MYYHYRDLRFVRCGKVEPGPLDDGYLSNAYRWLGRYCGYCPQIWLARSHSAITGHRVDAARDGVLFCFESVVGFPVDYNLWSTLLNVLSNAEDPHGVDGELVELLDRFCEDAELYAEQRDLLDSWSAHRDLHRLWQEHLFVLHDQVVVPRLNLGAAKRVFCRNERQKAKLRRLGFIEDRLEIKPWRRLT